ncbi:unnamed protein product [Rotaria sp. Silwood1]|nr:unnamed protein product [Rotaria sp. Silwood1]
MNMTTKSPKTPSQDAQGRWGDLLSPTQVLTGHEPTTSVVSKIKKKQPRNRKLQRYCRKLRKQGVDKATIQMYGPGNFYTTNRKKMAHLFLDSTMYTYTPTCVSFKGTVCSISIFRDASCCSKRAVRSYI